MRKIILGIFTIVFMAGCATPSTSKSTLYSDKSVYSATKPDSIIIYHAEPPRPFIKIGEVELIAEKYFGPGTGMTRGVIGNLANIGDTEASFESKLKLKAAEIGGNAIVIFEDTFAGVDNGATYGRKVRGTAIKFQS